MQGASLRTRSFLICDSTVGARPQTIAQYEVYCSQIQEPIINVARLPSMRLYSAFVLLAVPVCEPTKEALLVVQLRSIGVNTINSPANTCSVKYHSAGEVRNGHLRKCNGAPVSCTVTVQAAYTEHREKGGASRLHVRASCRGRFQHEKRSKSRTLFSIVNLLLINPI